MVRMRAIPSALRGAALMPAAALAVHQLRYELAYGGHASHALTAQGHAYLSSLTPWMVLLAGFGLGASLGGLAQRWAGAAGDRRAAGVRVWLLAALALMAIYAGQELIEGWFATGHAAGLAGVFGGGGWCALPAALLIGGLLALALRGEAALARALDGSRLRIPRPVARAADRLLLHCAPLLAAAAPLARHRAGRAPPRALAQLAV